MNSGNASSTRTANPVREIDKATFSKTDYGYSMDTPYGGADILDAVDATGRRYWEVQDVFGPEDSRGNVDIVSLHREFFTLNEAKNFAKDEIIRRYHRS